MAPEFLTNSEPSTIPMETFCLGCAIQPKMGQRWIVKRLFITQAASGQAFHAFDCDLRQANTEAVIDPSYDRHGIRYQFAIGYVDKLRRRIRMRITEAHYIVRNLFDFTCFAHSEFVSGDWACVHGF